MPVGHRVEPTQVCRVHPDRGHNRRFFRYLGPLSSRRVAPRMVLEAGSRDMAGASLATAMNDMMMPSAPRGPATGAAFAPVAAHVTARRR